MEFALAFGSVGDFIAVIALVKDILTALDDCRGSAKDYRDVVEALEILQKTLQQVSQIYKDRHITNDFPDLQVLAQSSIFQIQKSLEGFRDRTQKFAPSLSGRRKKHGVRDIARKIQWKFDEKDVIMFKDEIKGYSTSLNMLISVTIIRVMQSNHEACTKQATDNEYRTSIFIQKSTRMLKRHIGTIGRQVLFKLSFMAGLGADLRKTTRDLMAMMVVLSKELNGIKTLLSRVERPIGEEHFILEDFTGRAFPIHLKTVGSWDTFEYILTDRFKGKKGAHRVRRKRYSLQEKASGQPVDRSVDWENAFLPYQRINMSMMCQDAQGTVDRTLASCPWCQALSPEDSCTETQCRNCNMFFRRIIEDEDVNSSKNEAVHLEPIRAEGHSIRFGDSPFKRSPDQQRNDDESKVSATILPLRPAPAQSKKRKSIQDQYSDSDDEDLRGFVRITLVSKRRRGGWSHAKKPETFASVAQKVLGKVTSTSEVMTACPSNTHSPHTLPGAGPGEPVWGNGGPFDVLLEGSSFQLDRQEISEDSSSDSTNEMMGESDSEEDKYLAERRDYKPPEPSEPIKKSRMSERKERRRKQRAKQAYERLKSLSRRKRKKHRCKPATRP